MAFSAGTEMRFKPGVFAEPEGGNVANQMSLSRAAIARQFARYCGFSIARKSMPQKYVSDLVTFAVGEESGHVVSR